MQRSVPTVSFPRGIVPSMNTPFLEDGSIDVQGIRRSADAAISAGVAGMLVLAAAGETGSLTLSEKRLVATHFLDQAAGRVPVILGCSSLQQEERVALAAMARALGASAMLCQIPHGASGAKLVLLVQEIAAAGPSLLMLQDLDFGGPGLPMSDVLLLHQQVPAFQGLKIEVSMPGPKYSAVLQATQGALHVSGGWAAAQMLEALHRGVHAFIPTAMDVIYVEVFRRFSAGDHAGARELHAALTPVLAFSNQHIEVSIRFFKHLRHREGLFATPLCRLGVAALDAHHQRELEINVERVMELQRRVQGGSA